MSAAQKIKDRVELPQARIDIVKFHTDDVDQLQQQRFRLSLESYPHNVAPGIKVVDGTKRFRLKCLGVPMTEESFHLFIARWLKPVQPKKMIKPIQPMVLDIKIDNEVFENVSPVSGIPDSQGYYEFSFTK